MSEGLIAAAIAAARAENERIERERSDALETHRMDVAAKATAFLDWFVPDDTLIEIESEPESTASWRCVMRLEDAEGPIYVTVDVTPNHPPEGMLMFWRSTEGTWGPSIWPPRGERTTSTLRCHFRDLPSLGRAIEHVLANAERGWLLRRTWEGR
jgi:hypothetical protein